MFDLGQQIWRLSKQKEALGLCCDEDGLFLGNTPLLERRTSGFAPRPQGDLESIFSHGFGFAASLDHVMGGLTAVASALNAGDLCRARIAAVHLRIPDLPDEFARLDMQLEDLARKIDRVAKTAAAGDWNPAGAGGWDPDKHPRAGTAPNPGWFATTGGDGDGGIRPTRVSDEPDDDGRFHLPPGKRIDELGDLLEWIANAKPEDTQAIRGEIKRLYFDVGDRQGAAALNRALSDVLEDQDPRTRQSVLDNFEIYTRTDPAEVGQSGRDLLSGALLGPVSGMARPAIASAEAEAMEGAAVTEAATPAGAVAAEQTPSKVWGLGWAARGQAIDKAIKATLPKSANLADNFPIIDHATDTTITSIKSIDLNAATYQQPEILARRIDQYAKDVADFTTRRWGGVTVTASENTQRKLIIAIPRGAVSRVQQEIIDSAITRAQNRVQIRIVPF